MEILSTSIDTSSSDYQQNSEHHKRLASELKERLARVREGGGEKYRKRHEEQGKLFKVGGVLSTKPTAGEPQTGIGLAMSEALIREMGGAIWCESEPGKGAMFGIRLPLAHTATRARAMP